MSKAKEREIAAAERQVTNAAAAPSEAAQPEATEAQTVELSEATIERIGEVVARTLTPILLIHARLCAADTIRTMQKPETVFRHAIKEAAIVKTEIENHSQSMND